MTFFFEPLQDPIFFNNLRIAWSLTIRIFVWVFKRNFDVFALVTAYEFLSRQFSLFPFLEFNDFALLYFLGAVAFHFRVKPSNYLKVLNCLLSIFELLQSQSFPVSGLHVVRVLAEHLASERDNELVVLEF